MFSEAGTCDSCFANHIFPFSAGGTATLPSLPFRENKESELKFRDSTEEPS